MEKFDTIQTLNKTRLSTWPFYQLPSKESSFYPFFIFHAFVGITRHREWKAN